ncbi:(2Fe-2S)-binding protein [Paenibacillus sp. P96]|uniref:(2Fe-2S)-binding protein n=1 Tax=Paenibacillus zeirhizosphaerae TaxID=2987519 RepID=A0ABT9FR60_9BACL|nr:IucA/IucC family C-terminal-domain containing protein [Paenibacillus sp. P96]MDP4097198.1 (2Fe-2S)-binding protein [Paenibacillus sp. P96]
MLNAQLSYFEPAELEILSKDYRLCQNSTSDSSLSVPARELLDIEKCQAYLEQAADIFSTSAKAAAASQFSKRYAYLTMASGLYAMTMFNKGLNYAIENCRIESVFQGSSWLPEVSLTDCQVTQPPEEGRTEWRDRIITSIFAENIAKVWCSISKAARIPTSILWENMAISVYWLYEQRMVEEATEEQKLRIQADFHYLLYEAPAHLFGEKENPLTKFNNSHMVMTASNIPKRKRKTCCLLYKVSQEHDYCTTCPLRKE